MDPELAEAYAERDFRMMHKDRTWTKRDQADQDGWEKHDNEGHLILIHRNYKQCWLCFPEVD